MGELGAEHGGLGSRREPARVTPTRWAIVTGATGAVGGACAESLGQAGLGVIVHGRRPDAVEAVVAKLRSSGVSARPLVADLGAPAAFAEALAALPEPPLVLVNAAADFGPLAPVAELLPEQWQRMFALNVEGPLALIGALVPAMLEQGWGRIVQIGSAAAVARPGTGNAAYSVTKAALDRALGHLAAEVAGTGVTVHSLHPGEIASRMWQHIQRESARPGFEGYAQWASSTGQAPDDLAAVASFLAALLEDDEAHRRHGRFSWAQQPERTPLALGVILAD